MKKRRLILSLIIIFLVSGCTIELPDSQPIDDDKKVESNNEEKIERLGKTSSIENPLMIGSWGIASKYNALEDKYDDIDVLLEMVDGDVSEMVEEYNVNNPVNVIVPKEGYKGIVFDYEVSLYNFKTESFGSDVLMDIEVVDDKGNNIIIDEVKQVIPIVVMDAEQGIMTNKAGKVRIYFELPETINNYIVKIGTKNHTIAYYKV